MGCSIDALHRFMSASISIVVSPRDFCSFAPVMPGGCEREARETPPSLSSIKSALPCPAD